MGNAIKFKNTSVPRHPEERARLKVVQGPDFGAVFVITGPSVSIGRGEGNDIVLTDLKSSRFHAVIVQEPNGKWSVKDQASANGIMFNNKLTRNAEMKFNDVFTIGETTLEFLSGEAATHGLMAPPRSSSAIAAEQKAFQGVVDGLRARFGKYARKSSGSSSELKESAPKLSGPVSKGAKSRPPLLYVAAAVMLGLFFLVDSENPAPQKAKKKTDESSTDLASLLPPADFNKTADMLYKDGLREYFDQNYGRARSQFETVLQISPNHALAILYLENCNKAVDSEVEVNLVGGKKSLEAGKLRDAKGHFETVMRLLHREQASPKYIEAKDRLEQVMKEIKGEAGKT